MDNKGWNDGFRVLDDFVSEATPGLDVALADEQHRGRNAGLLIVEELSLDASCDRPNSEETQDPDSSKPPNPDVLRASC